MSVIVSAPVRALPAEMSACALRPAASAAPLCPARCAWPRQGQASFGGGAASSAQVTQRGPVPANRSATNYRSTQALPRGLSVSVAARPGLGAHAKPEHLKVMPAKGEPSMALSGCSVSTAAPGCSVEIAALDSSLTSDVSDQSIPATPEPARPQALGAYDLIAGSHSRTGKKVNMPDWQNQDTCLVLPLGRARTLVAVLDGHGRWGHLVAARVREAVLANAPRLVPAAPTPLADATAGRALRQLFALAEEALAREVDVSGRPLTEFSGTTATMAIADATTGRMAVAHVGDSALMLAAGCTVFHRTADHVVDAEAERRVLSRGGEVRSFTISGISARRICLRGSQFPGLAMSRALGDSVAQSIGVSCEPEVHCGIPFPPGTTLVVASDGVWEKARAEEVAHRVNGLRDAQSAAWTVVEAARAQWNQEGNIDDITAVVLACVHASPGATYA